MNIIKLKDIVMSDNHELSTFFNEQLKGKYAYWIQMRYIFPLDSLDYKSYVTYEQMDYNQIENSSTLHIDVNSTFCKNCNFMETYVDLVETDNVNAINSYKIANAKVTDADIDISKLRKFRTWLAEEILTLSMDLNGNYLNNLNEQQIHVLEYYKNNMYNDVVKHLNVFGFESLQPSMVTTGCSCCNNTVYPIPGVPETCNALNIYTNNLHNLMVSTFENVEFWLQFNKEFINTFKRYIDNIIKVGFIVKPSADVLYSQCNCNNDSLSASTAILKNLSDALSFIINNNTAGHINFIYDALHNWADQLYDHMQWDIK
jgi:hypothetical protein